MKKVFIIYLLSNIFFLEELQSQTLFRSGMFFHHSSGEYIWGPNGSSTSVPQEMARYNTQHGYFGQNAVTLSETWYPVNYDNEWAIWHDIFTTNSPENISSYFAGNKIIMVKSCFPSSAIEEIGQAIDTLTPDYKTVYNYKWHWRNIISVMRSHPQNFFVIWTNAPLTLEETTPASALLSKQFCKWAKDTLANGLDPVFGAFPNNVYVFDYFSKLTNASGYMQSQYAVGPHDPHPNSAATALVAPQLVDEVFNHSIYYEYVFGVKKINESIPSKFSLYQNYPNPFNPYTKIKFDIAHQSFTKVFIYDILGREVTTLVNEELRPGSYEVEWNCSDNPSGVYFYKLTSGDFSMTKRMVLVK